MSSIERFVSTLAECYPLSHSRLEREVIDGHSLRIGGMAAITAAGFVPANDVYVSVGHDEETLGTGALSIARVLAGRGVRAALVLDEGGAIVEGVFPGVTAPVAVAGVSEKGITTLRLRVEQHGGHASTPPAWSATVRLARAHRSRDLLAGIEFYERLIERL